MADNCIDALSLKVHVVDPEEVVEPVRLCSDELGWDEAFLLDLVHD